MSCWCGGCANVVLIIVTILCAFVEALIPYFAFLSNDDIKSTSGDNFSKRSISRALAEASSPLYMILMIIFAVLVVFVGYARKVQISVMLDRNYLYKTGVKIVNVFAFLVLIVAAIATIVVAILDTDSYNTIHMYAIWVQTGALWLFFALHIILYLIERCGCSHEFPTCAWRYVELFYWLPIWLLSVYFGFAGFWIRRNGPLASFNEDLFGYGYDDRFWYDWVSYWLVWYLLLPFGLIFYRNPDQNAHLSCKRADEDQLGMV